jgi:hypothetical protein
LGAFWIVFAPQAFAGGGRDEGVVVMGGSRALALLALALTSAVAGTVLPAAAQRAANNSVQLAGRTVRCKDVRIVTDRGIPSEGAQAPGVLILNPDMLNAQPATVRLFVFHHECGHHNVGDSELEADCWAVGQGVRDGWLDAKGLDQVCLSFEDAPETSTHPSGRRRCRNLDRCFASALSSQGSKTPTRAIATAPPSKLPTSAQPRLVSGPNLVATGTLRYADTTGCEDPIGRLIEGKRPPRC